MSSHEPRCNCKQLTVVMYGERPDRTDGLLWIAINNSQTLHGTRENPGGIVRLVEDHERLKLKAIGIITAIGMFFTVVNGLLTFGPAILRMLSQ